jgi:cytochrome d ubiquinol oxidase subunit II
MDLPLLSAFAVAAALTLYLMLDGFDLGVGSLLLLARDEDWRDRMIASIAPTWDGNETWLVMAAVAIFAAFPVAYGVLLPAFYLPLILMLLALGLRGVSIEFRFQTKAWRRFWDRAFWIGSVVAALMQGLIVGGLVQGVTMQGDRFSGSVFDVFGALPALTGLAVLAGHALLGAGWLHLKAEGALRGFAERALHRLPPVFLTLAICVCVAAAVAQPRVASAWDTHPVALGAIAVLAVAVTGILMRSIGRTDGAPFALGLVLFALGLTGLAIVIFPWVIPYERDLWSATSPTLSHVFLLVGFAVVGPVVLAYTAFSYRVFRGKTPEKGWES